MDAFPNATWTDVYSVLELCKKTAYMYQNIGKTEKYEYIINEVLPMINAYISVLQQAGYDADLIYSKKIKLVIALSTSSGTVRIFISKPV